MKPIETFYAEFIDMKIAHCELSSNELGRKPLCMHLQSDMKRAQALFLEDRKESLIEALVKSDKERDIEKINLFLNREFLSSLAGHVPANGDTQPVDSEIVAEHSEYYPNDDLSLRKMLYPSRGYYGKEWDSAVITRLFELPGSDGLLLCEEE